MRTLLLIILICSSTFASAGELRVVPTFEAAGLSWKPGSGKENLTCHVRYRMKGAPEWKTGYPLWFDAREHQWGNEYRGSLVHLKSNTEYEVEVKAGSQSATATFKTWPDEFPTGTVRRLPETSSAPLLINQSGTVKAWRVYQPSEDSRAMIDVNNEHENCIRIENASHIIIRRLSLTGAARHAIQLVGDVHDIVIEDCDVRYWGAIEPDGWGHNLDSAIYSKSPETKRIIIQRNRIHHPRADSNNWAELRPTERDPDNHHPEGPQAVTFIQSSGNHVIRHNRVWSDHDHQFNDIFGGGANYSTIGFPNCDSDIYGNRLSHCWDDAIESEGGNRNVRIWGNHIDKTFVHIASATTSVGPLYIFRNVAGETRRNDNQPADMVNRGAFLKTSDKLGGGRIYLFHNTLLQPPPRRGNQNPLGCQLGMGHGGGMLNVISRNNIFHTSMKGGPFNDRTKDPKSDYDFDLYNGQLMDKTQERHGVVGIPTYSPQIPPEQNSFWLPYSLTPANNSLAIDAGTRLPNFNDGYSGNAPDIGAFENTEADY